MEFLTDYGLFFAKTATVVIAFIVIIGAVATAVQRSKGSGAQLDVDDLNSRYRALKDTLNARLLSDAERKSLEKQEKKAEKARQKARKSGNETPRPRIFVIDFEGDIRASGVDSLREEISAVLQVARPDDEVLVRLESPGGLVHGYGLAASQLRRIRDRGIQLVASVDKVAASGGYMMACVADRIIAAPFAVIGSIGVVGQLPNFNRLLKEHNIDFEMHTAGEHKRTLSLFGENSEDARRKFREELEETHELFKAFVRENRRALDVDAVSTGEHWFGTRALELKLVDELRTSDDYLLDALERADVINVRYDLQKSITQKLTTAIENRMQGSGLGLVN